MTTNAYPETNVQVIEKALYCLKHGETESVENWLDLLRERLTENSHPAVRVCAIADIECSRGCGTGACKREQPAAPIDDLRQEVLRLCRLFLDDEQGKYNARAVMTQIFSLAVTPTPSPADERAAKSISDEMMDLVDRLGSEYDKVDPRAWRHLLVYAPKPEEMDVLKAPVEMNNWHGRHAYAAGWNDCCKIAARAASASETGAEGLDGLAHELWSAAQLAPGEGIEDGVRRITTILSRSPATAAAETRAWETDDGRVISDMQKQQALRDGGASASSVRPFSIALGRIGAVPAMAAEAVAIYQILTEEGAWLDVPQKVYDRTKSDPALTRVVYAAPQPPAQVAMPRLTDAMRAVIENDRGAYQSSDQLYAALCEAARLEPPAQADAREGLTNGTRAALFECAETYRSNGWPTIADEIDALIQGANHAE